MSESVVIDFAEATRDDPELRARAVAAKGLEGFVALAADSGYEFTVEDVIHFASALMGASEELSDEELDAVAGGGQGSVYQGFMVNHPELSQFLRDHTDSQ